MLDYLITPKTKRKLVKLLWQDGVEASASELAKRIGVSFSTAYSELKEMELAGLATCIHQKKNVIFKAAKDHSRADLLRKLLDSDERAKKNSKEEDSAALASIQSFGENLSEDDLINAIKLSRRYAAIARMIPVMLFKQRGLLDFESLKKKSHVQGERKTLGFFLELTSTLSSDSFFSSFSNDLIDLRDKRVEKFFLDSPNGKYQSTLEKMNTPKIAKKWHFKMNMNFEVFKTHFDKFTTLSSTRK